MSKSIKLKDNNYWDSSSIIHDKTPLPTFLPFAVIATGYLDNETKTISLADSGVVFMLITYHIAHGSCGGNYLLFRGFSSGNNITALKNSEHCIVNYTDDILTMTVDTWGTSYKIVRLV